MSDKVQGCLPFKRRKIVAGELVEVTPTVSAASRPYKCGVCSKRFATAPGLAGHRVVHEKTLPTVPIVSSGASSSTDWIFTPVSETFPFPTGVDTSVSEMTPAASSEASAPVASVAEEPPLAIRKKRKTDDLRCGAKVRRSLDDVTKDAVLAKVSEYKKAGVTNVYERVSEELHVPYGNISRWVKNKDTIGKRASVMRASELLGMKAKRLGKTCRAGNKQFEHDLTTANCNIVSNSG